MAEFRELIEALDKLAHLGPVISQAIRAGQGPPVSAAHPSAGGESGGSVHYEPHQVLTATTGLSAQALSRLLGGNPAASAQGLAAEAMAEETAAATDPDRSPSERRRRRRKGGESPPTPETYGLEPIPQTPRLQMDDRGNVSYRPEPETYNTKPQESHYTWRRDKIGGLSRHLAGTPAEPEPEADPESAWIDDAKAAGKRRGPGGTGVLAQAMQRLTAALAILATLFHAKGGTQKSVADEVHGLSLGQRWRRLEESGKLLSGDQVRQDRLLQRPPTRQQILLESEANQQRDRDRQARGQSPSSVLRRAWSALRGGGGEAAETATGAAGAAEAAGGSGAAGGVAARLAGMLAGPQGIAVAAVAAGIGLAKLPDIAESVAAGLMQAKEGLARYDVGLQNTLTKMDYQKRRLDMRTAGATSGSSQALGGELMKLRDEMQPLREFGENLKNLAGTALVEIGRGVAAIAKAALYMNPLFWLVKWMSKKDDKSGELAPVLEHLRQIELGNFGGPKNKKPLTDAQRKRHFNQAPR